VGIVDSCPPSLLGEWLKVHTDKMCLALATNIEGVAKDKCVMCCLVFLTNYALAHVLLASSVNRTPCPFSMVIVFSEYNVNK